MQTYLYDGPVMKFDICIQNHWKGITRATSEKKARGNLMYRFKKENNYTSSAKIDLPGKIIAL